MAKLTMMPIEGVREISSFPLNMTVVEENPKYSVEVSQHPVEDLGSIVDHVVRNPIEMSINGVVVGKDAGEKIARLRRFNQEGTLLKYVGRNLLDNCIIESLDTSHTTAVSNGFEFDIKLLVIRKAKTQYVTLYGSDPVTLMKYTSTQMGTDRPMLYSTLKDKIAELQGIKDKLPNMIK